MQIEALLLDYQPTILFVEHDKAFCDNVATNVVKLYKKERPPMDNEKVFAMSFAKVYPMLIAKAERKGRTREDVLEVTTWLTGYTHEEIEALLNNDTTYGDFFRKAPALNPNRLLIKGSICGVKVELIEDPLMQNIRYLDKLVDELAKGKAMEKVLRK